MIFKVFAQWLFFEIHQVLFLVSDLDMGIYRTFVSPSVIYAAKWGIMYKLASESFFHVMFSLPLYLPHSKKRISGISFDESK